MNLYYALSLASFLLFMQASFFAWRLPVSLRERVAFILSGVSFSIFSFFTFSFSLTNNLELIYVLDRFASIGWTSFPAIMVWLVYLMRNKSNRIIKRILLFFLVPLALISFVRYNVEPETLKAYYLYSGMWFFELNRASPFFYLFVVYLMSSMAALIYLLFTWWKNSNTQRARYKIVSIVVGIISFFLISTLSNLLLPYLRLEHFPPLAHINSLFMGAGFFIAVILLKQPELSSAIVSRFIESHLKELVLFFDQNFKLYAVNNFCINLLSYNSNEILKLSIEDHLGTNTQRLMKFAQSPADCSDLRFETTVVARNGQKIPVQFTQINVVDNFKDFVGLVLIGQDLSEKKLLKKEIAEREHNQELLRQTGLNLEDTVKKRTLELIEANQLLVNELIEKQRTEAQIISDLEQKGLLLQEIHHRVKNNFQIIISLTKMVETNSCAKADTKIFLGLLGDKIRAISGMHEYFYSTKKINSINFGQFLRKTSVEVNAEYASQKQVSIKLRVGNENLDLNQALPCGLFYKELLSIVLQWAFESDLQTTSLAENHPVVEVDFFKSNGNFHLLIGHNGKGFSDAEMQSAEFNLSLSLIKLLADSYLGGEFVANNDERVSFKLVFPRNGQPRWSELIKAAKIAGHR